MDRSRIGRFIRLLVKAGPFLAVALLLPGGIVLAILLWISRHRQVRPAGASLVRAEGTDQGSGTVDSGPMRERMPAASLHWCRHGGVAK